jgi:3-phytase
VSLVAASNRTHDSISLYRVDVATRQLVDVADGLQATGLPDPYGLCMYHSAVTGEYYAFVNGSGDGLTRQFRLVESSPGRVSAEPVREIAVGGQAEGCVADDESGALFVAEEDHGLWKYAAESDAGTERSLIDSVEGEHLVADVEGVSIWLGENGGGYIVLSNQGEDNYVLYERAAPHAFAGKFHLVANAVAGIDGVSETDGLDVSSASLGPQFPDGLLVTQDGRNIAPAERQNFKLTSWRDVMAALEAARD